MRKKYFFFDIDGTLTTENPGGVILPSTFKTLDTLRENGHFVSIATGRSQRMAMPFAREARIENMVTDGGNGLTLDNEVVYIKPLERKGSLEIVNECLEKDLDFCVSIDNTDYYYSHSNGFSTNGRWGNMNAKLKVIEDIDYSKLAGIHKIFIGLKKEEEHMLTSIHGEIGYSRYLDEHIIVEPEDKFSGIRAMMEHLRAPIEDVVVFGDARNDLGMVKEAAMSVAMGNAIPELKELATFITRNSDDDGIEYACRHFGWI